MQLTSRTGRLVSAALIPLTLLIAGCGGSSSGGSTDGGSSSASHGLNGRLATAGIDCGDKKLADGDHVDCDYQGQNVTVTPGSWAALTAERQKVCASGFISAEDIVATDDTTVTVAVNYPSQARAIAKALGIKTEPYCPS